MIFKNTFQIEKYLFAHIAKDQKKLFSGQEGILKVKSVLQELDNPQDQLKIIHIAGTSGKGSTAFLISKMLFEAGFKVGLHISPHLLDVRERFQVNNRLISQEKFLKYFNEIFSIIEKRDIQSSTRLSYFEILTIFSFYVFFREKVDYAIIETGLGGLYDATNTINAGKLVVLTKLGLDHTNILGKTIAKIAYQKAMIVQDRNIVISCWQDKPARKIIEKIVRVKRARLFYVLEHLDYFNIKLTPTLTSFDWKFQDFTLQNIKMAMLGRNQAENCALALAAVANLSLRDHFSFESGKIRKSLSSARFPGRLELKKIRGKIVILDGAHNPQKMASFLANLNEIFPNGKFNFLIGFKKGKAISAMLHQIIPLSCSITLTSFFQGAQDMPNFSETAKKLKLSLKKMGFNRCQAVPKPKAAFEAVMAKEGITIVTGSLYLIAEIYPTIIKGRR